MPPPSRPSAPLRSSDDLELVRRVAAKDAPALAELHDRYAGMLIALARRILGAAGEAEEVVQEALVQVWNQAERYDPGRSSVSTWLILITRSRALDRLRGRQARERTNEAALAEPAADTSSRAEEHVLHRERRARVRAALAELPEEQRRVLELAFYEGLSQSEIATRTGTPLGTVKTRALLGMKKLRQALRPVVRELI
jgi:RNA polymerase sigma-70 factor (ECF subfamily)